MIKAAAKSAQNSDPTARSEGSTENLGVRVHKKSCLLLKPTANLGVPQNTPTLSSLKRFTGLIGTCCAHDDVYSKNGNVKISPRKGCTGQLSEVPDAKLPLSSGCVTPCMDL